MLRAASPLAQLKGAAVDLQLLSPADPGSEPMAEVIPPVETDEGPATDASPDAPEPAVRQRARELIDDWHLDP